MKLASSIRYALRCRAEEAFMNRYVRYPMFVFGSLLVLSVAAPAFAQKVVAKPPPEEQKSTGTTSAPTDPDDMPPPYQGVTLNGGEPPAPPPTGTGFHYLTWPGFRATEKGTSIFLQLTGEVKYKTKVKGERIEVTLHGVKNYLRNNLLPVVTTAFPGPVARFRLIEHKGDKMTLEVILKQETQPVIKHQVVGAYHYLVVKLPTPQNEN